MSATAASEDDALARGVAAGDPGSWQALMDAHLSAITAYAWQMLGDREEAEDVAQETFIRFMKKAAAWRPGGARLLVFRVHMKGQPERHLVEGPQHEDDHDHE